MDVQVCIQLDTRRLKNSGVYPLKLRVYFNGKADLYPTIYNLSKQDYSKLKAKRINEELESIKRKISDIELKAKAAVRDINPFDFDKFYMVYIRSNPYFKARDRTSKIKESSLASGIDIPVEWSNKFKILVQHHPGPDYVSSVYSSIIRSLLYQAKIGTAVGYQTSYNSLIKFRGNIRLFEITARFLKEYEGWLINTNGNNKTTVGIYMKSVRAVINEAIESKLMLREDYPFGRRRYAIPSGRNIKKALDKASIAKLYYSESEAASQQMAKDYWFFSFYGHGMNVKDIIHLQYKNIQGEFLVFERAKTETTTRGGQPIIISCFLNEDMLRIIAKWGNKDKSADNYIFPILSPGLTPIRQFEIKQNFTQFINE